MTSPAAPPKQPQVSEILRKTGAILRRLGPAGPAAIIAMTLPALGGVALLSTMSFVGPWLKSHGELGVVMYALGFAVLAGLALLPTYAQSVLAGWAFGIALGYPAAVVGVIGGALIGYFIGRRASGDRALQIIHERPKLEAVYISLLCCGFWKALLIVTLIRIPPSSPFALTNLFLAAMRVNPLAYVLGTTFGLAPRAGVAVFVGAGLHELTLTQSPDKWVWVVGIVLTLIVVVIIGHMANRAIAKVTAPAT